VVGGPPLSPKDHFGFVGSACAKLLKRKLPIIERGSFHMGLKRACQYDATKAAKRAVFR
jgi:hypothetical protein